MQVPVPIQVRLRWRASGGLDDAQREGVTRELTALAWELSQAEALLHDVDRLAGPGRGFLMPRIELLLPLYEVRRRLRIVLSRLEGTRIHLVDEEGKRLADVLLS